MRETVVVSAARTPFGRFGGGLKSLSAMDLGALAIKESVKRAGITGEQIDYIYMGHVLQGGCGQVPSRQASVKAGLPWQVPSITVNKVCSSGLISVALADLKIRSGDADIVIAGGMESMSNAPYYLPDTRWGIRMGDGKAVDLMMKDGLWCPFYDRHMAVHGSEVAAEFGISREAQDEWALDSQMKAVAAIKNGSLKAEIIPVEIETPQETFFVEIDEGPKPNTTRDGLAKLSPVFTKEGECNCR